MYRGGEEIKSAYANAGTEVDVGYVSGIQVYSTVQPIPIHTHSFDVGIEFASGGSADIYGFNHIGSGGIQGTLSPPYFTGSIRTSLPETMRVGAFAGGGAVLDNHGWTFLATRVPESNVGTGDGSALQQVWVETEPDTYLLLFDIDNTSAGVFYHVNQENAIDDFRSDGGWSVEGINPGRSGDANPWKVYEGQTKKCLINFNNSIPKQDLIIEHFSMVSGLNALSTQVGYYRSASNPTFLDAGSMTPTVITGSPVDLSFAATTAEQVGLAHFFGTDDTIIVFNLLAPPFPLEGELVVDVTIDGITVNFILTAGVNDFEVVGSILGDVFDLINKIGPLTVQIDWHQ
jgi:hypothetical protein